MWLKIYQTEGAAIDAYLLNELCGDVGTGIRRHVLHHGRIICSPTQVPTVICLAFVLPSNA